MQLARGVVQGGYRVPHFGDALLQRVEPLQSLTLRTALKNQRLDLLELVLHGIDRGKIAVDDRFKQRVKNDTRTLLEQLGLALQALSYAE